MLNIQIPLHTIIFTVAPSNSGKSYFLNNFLLKQLKENYSDLNIQYLSSDDIRRELLGVDLHKHDPMMLQVSEQAFDLMYKKMDLLMSFPISAEIIVVDSTGLSEIFRNDMLEKAKKFNYHVMPFVFDYNDREDYFSFKDEKTQNIVIAKHLDKLKKDVLKTLKKDKYIDVVRIRTKDFASLKLDFEIKDYEFYKSHNLNRTDVEYVVVSDIHGCLEEFKEIIYKNNCTIDEEGNIIGEKVFIVQDFLDKGYDILGTIRFIYQNTLNGSVVPLIGNHENYVYKRLSGELKTGEHDIYFSSIQILEEPTNLIEKNKFLELFKRSRHFYKNKNFFVNHAPCEAKYLGKIDKTSFKKQRSFIYPKKDASKTMEENVKAVETSLAFINEQSQFNARKIVWGHIMLPEHKTFDNIMMIDTGCVAGNKLTSVSFDKYGKAYIKSASSSRNEKVKKEEIVPIFHKNKVENKVSLEELEPEDRMRINFLIRNKVNFISGTVSPSNKNAEGKLEDLEQGLLYYKNNGISKVILQPKYMGSRCNIYLNRDVDKTYCITRNGFLVKIDYREALKPLYEIDYIKSLFELGVEMVILDSELMPWKAIGAGLIDEQFLSVRTGITSELEILKSTGFEEQLQALINHDKLEEFKSDFSIMKKNDLIEKYGYRVYETFKNVLEYKDEHIALSQTEEYVNTYNRQMNLYASEGKVEFKPFSILKIIHSDGREELMFEHSNVEIFKSISKDEYYVVDFSKEDWLKSATTFYNNTTKGLEMEGVVIKPEKVYNKGIAPYLKCRNENYLTIIYGYDFKKENKYKKLVKRKSITQKLKASIQEFEIGKKMLEIPYNKIEDGNQEFISLCVQMILDENNLKTLDPRL